MPLKRATGIVIRSFDYGESDRIVTFLTREYGKVRGIAKGARRSRRRFANSLDLFCHVRVLFAEKEERPLMRIDQCDVVEFFPTLGQDVARMSYGSYFAELVDAMLEEGEAHRGVFDLLRGFLSILDQSGTKEEMLRIFEVRLLSLVGYRPTLESCVRCGSSIDGPGRIWFVPARGGVFCERCRPAGEESFPLALGTARILEKAVETDLSKIERLRFSPLALRESREILPRFVKHHLNRELKSLRFLESIKSAPS
ncbi:MAG: DNA repair protein RecO [Deltaproteobacteria bacterium]|nr:DNA repair protein RecO [Deltaproteobacteria bacterium]MBW2122114.1 DNA repair protein RecO [Deltaproteobacteria bacterium]